MTTIKERRSEYVLNILYAGLLFVGVLAVAACLGALKPPVELWLAGTFLMLAMFFLSYWCVSEPIRMFCAHCGKYSPSNIDWTCGYCGTGNKGADHSFLGKCDTCKRPPPGFKCPHGCGRGIFAENDDGSRSHWAYKRGDSPATPMPAPPEPSQAEFERQLRQLDNDIKLTKLRRDLELAKKAFERVREPEESKAEPERDPVEEVLKRIQQATRKEEAVSGYVFECKERWLKEGRPKDDIERLTMRLKAVTTQVMATIDTHR
jgi:hypothetical protein